MWKKEKFSSGPFKEKDENALKRCSDGKKPCWERVCILKAPKETENGCGKVRMIHTDLELGLWREQIYSTLCLQHLIPITSTWKPITSQHATRKNEPSTFHCCLSYKGLPWFRQPHHQQCLTCRVRMEVTLRYQGWCCGTSDGSLLQSNKTACRNRENGKRVRGSSRKHN